MRKRKPKKKLKNLTALDAAMPNSKPKVGKKRKNPPRKIPKGQNIGWVA